MLNRLDRTVAQMMSRYGTTATIRVVLSESYDPELSENVQTTHDYPVKAMFFDYIRKDEGDGTKGTTLVQSGDKQVYIQPPQKSESGIPLPHITPGKDALVVNGDTYKIVTVKQINPAMTASSCVLYELYVRK